MAGPECKEPRSLGITDTSYEIDLTLDVGSVQVLLQAKLQLMVASQDKAGSSGKDRADSDGEAGHDWELRLIIAAR